MKIIEIVVVLIVMAPGLWALGDIWYHWFRHVILGKPDKYFT
jgi:hypothetical protein